MKKNIAIILIILMAACWPLFSDNLDIGNDDLFQRGVPFFYGEEVFTERLEELKEDGPVWALNLSGGSARAFAHVGVLKRLEEEGLVPDVIVTNSMGSIVGMLYAAGVPVSTLEDLLVSTSLSRFFDVEMPINGGLMATDAFRGLLKELVGDIDISELPTPILVLTEDLYTKRQVVLAKGPFEKVMMAAFALPVYFNPENIGEYRLVDGGATNLVPLKPFEGLFDATVISTTFYSKKISMTNPLNILNATIDIAKSRRAVDQILHYKPFMIRCDVEDFSFMAFDQGEELIAKGYESADKRIDELKTYLEGLGIESSEPKAIPAFAETLTQAKLKINHGIPITLAEPTWGMGLEFLNWRAFSSPHLLYSEFLTGAKAYFAIPHLKGEIHALYGGNDTIGPLAVIEGDIGNSFQYRLDSYWPFSLDENNSPSSEGNYEYAEIKYTIPIETMSLSPLIMAEINNIDSGGWDEILVRGGLHFEKQGKTHINLNGEVYGQNTGLSDPWTLGAASEATLRQPLFGDFYFTGRAFGRIPFEAEDSAPLYFPDFYRSARFSLGEEDSQLIPGGFGLGNFAIAWRVGNYVPTVAELLVLKESEVALFSDILLSGIREGQDLTIMPTAGLDLRLNVSLIGLKAFDLHIMGGWDFYDEAPFFMVNLGDEIP